MSKDEGEMKARAMPSAPRTVGRLAGATAALPAAACVFVVAALSGVPAGTSVLRAVATGAALWLLVGLAVRVLFAFLIEDSRAARSRTRSSSRRADREEREDQA